MKGYILLLIVFVTILSAVNLWTIGGPIAAFFAILVGLFSTVVVLKQKF